MVVLAFIIGILVLLFLITLHEFGHFIMAKIFKVYVYEFSIGFGPKIISWNGKETKYVIRLFPFGGYVNVASEFLDSPKGKEDIIINKKRYIEGVNRGKRLLIILSGIIMNFAIAAIMFTSVFTISGYSPNDLHGYGAQYYQESDSPATILGLNNPVNYKNPNVITQIAFFHYDGKGLINNTIPISKLPTKKLKYKTISMLTNPKDFYSTALQLQSILKIGLKDNNSDLKNSIVVKYGQYDYQNHKIINPTKSPSVGYNYGNKTKYKLGNKYIIGMKAPNLYFSSTGEAYKYGWEKTFTESVTILKSFGKLFTGQWSQLSGPIGAAEQTKTYIQSAPSFFLYVAVLSANLFILNLIPIPPLDGFKFTEVFIELCIRKELNRKIKFFVTIIGASLFLLLFIGLTLKDLFL